jgi:hypothetical protein
MRKIFISLLAIGVFPAIAFPQFLCQDTISIKRNSEAVIIGSEVDSTYEYLNNILPVNDNPNWPCQSKISSFKHIYPLYPHLPYPNPFSPAFGWNKQRVLLEQGGKILLVLTDNVCNVKYIIDMGNLVKGSEIWHSPGEIINFKNKSSTLHVVLNDSIFDRTAIAYYNEMSEGLEIGWEPDDIYPNCTLVKMADTTRVNNNNFDFMFELKDEYPFTILELLDSNNELIRYFFRMYLDKGIYGVYFSRIDATYKPLECGDYKLRLTISDSTYICNFKIVE